MRSTLQQLHTNQAGHAALGLVDIFAGAGAIVLAIGAASNEDVVTIIGGIGLGVGIVASGVVRHMQIDYSVWDRLEELEDDD